MTIHTFNCIDAHTCGNPVRLVAKGGPQLSGITIEKEKSVSLHGTMIWLN